MDYSHLDALNMRLSNERARLANDPTNTLRQVWVAGIEKEITDERIHLGLSTEILGDMSEDDLLAELFN